VLNLPQFKVSWKDVTRVSQNVTTGMSEEEAQAIARAERPFMVYVYNDEIDAESRFAIETASAFADDKVAVGARFFSCVRIDAATAKEDHALKEHIGRANSLIFVRPDYKVSKVFHFKGTKIQARKVFGEMCATMRLDYENCVKTAYAKTKKLQKERVKLDQEQAKITQIDDKIVNEKSAKRRDKLVAKRDKLQDELDAQYEKIDGAEAKLFELTAKTAKATS
jgi:hypothetical protein